MRTTVTAVLTVVALLAVAARTAAQDPPYSGLEAREIKALSPDRIEAYSAGAGMGLALAAELNNYPGPRHVLELAKELVLSQETRARTVVIYDEMHAAAVALGKEIVSLEAALDEAFASGDITEEVLARSIDAIAERQGRLRLTHLRAHLRMKEILTPHQVEIYRHLRGYGGADGMRHDPGQHGQH